MSKQTQTEQEAAQDTGQQIAPPEAIAQRMDRLTKELDEWCNRNGVVIVPVAMGIKTKQLANIADWQPDTHIFTRALAPKGQQL